jgi:hypothetical protein
MTMLRISQDHLCEGGCGQVVSASRRLCLHCMATQVQKNLVERGDVQVVPLAEIRRELRGAIFVETGKIV